MKRRGQRGTKATFGRALREEVIARQAGDVFEAALANRELLQLATARMKKSPTTTQAIGLTMCVALARMSLIKPGGTSNLGGKPASHKPEHPKAASRVPSTLAKLTRDSVLETETSIRSGKSGRKKMERGRIGFALSVSLGLMGFGSVTAQQPDASRTGWISDESCGREHTKPGRADCVEKCWRGGASVGHPEWKAQRAVFVADTDQGIWIVENPEAVRKFPATHVGLVGKFDSAKKTLYVETIAAVRR